MSQDVIEDDAHTEEREYQVTLTSIAISLKRIADALETKDRFERRVTLMDVLRDIANK